jgi:hypothetical protein
MMAVYVDELFDTERTKQWPYPKACHLTADTLDELHEFAIKVGLRRQWFQPHKRHPHYDLTEGRRRIAVRLSAVSTDSRTLTKSKMIKIEQQTTTEEGK